MCETGSSGPKPPQSAHGPRAQAEERRNRRRARDTQGSGEEKGREGGELVSSRPPRSDNDGAVLPCYAPGKFTSSAESRFFYKQATLLRKARSGQGKITLFLILFFSFLFSH